MGFGEKHNKEIKAYGQNTLDNLTVNDALILIAVCAVKEKADIDENHIDDASKIETLAKKDPIFKNLKDSINPSINKFINMIGEMTELVRPVLSAAKVLKPEYNKIAFSWVVKIIMPDGVLSEKRKTILDKYALLLEVDGKVEQQILVDASR
jgi:hypothetical protein